jgi:hypothetical protein
LCDLRPGFCIASVGEDNDDSDLSRRDEDEYDDADSKTLEKRGYSDVVFHLVGLAREAFPIRRFHWPSRGILFNTDYRRRTVVPTIFTMRRSGSGQGQEGATADDCEDTTIDTVPIDTSRPLSEIRQLLRREKAQSEHVEDVGDLKIGFNVVFWLTEEATNHIIRGRSYEYRGDEGP